MRSQKTFGKSLKQIQILQCKVNDEKGRGRSFDFNNSTAQVIVEDNERFDKEINHSGYFVIGNMYFFFRWNMRKYVIITNMTQSKRFILYWKYWNILWLRNLTDINFVYFSTQDIFEFSNSISKTSWHVVHLQRLESRVMKEKNRYSYDINHDFIIYSVLMRKRSVFFTRN